MKNERQFFRCAKCGNLVELIEKGAGVLVCCGSEMQEVQANSVEASQEKHIPQVSRKGNQLSVEVGSAPHPMLSEHWISWIAVAQGNKTQRATLQPGEAPKAVFSAEEGPAVVYSYCNLHGLWKVEVE